MVDIRNRAALSPLEPSVQQYRGRDLIVFDMDGVLVEVTESYRATIQATVKHFTGNEPARPEIQEWKNRGGFNDDWNLSHAMIAERGVTTAFQDVVDHFQTVFHGTGETAGLILKEKWIAREGMLESLARNHTFAIFTGRLVWEAKITLDRFTTLPFEPIMGVDTVTNPKPDPEGLLNIQASTPHDRIWYIGDSVDDAKAGAAAGIPFIGIASHPTEIGLLKHFGAVAVIKDINDLETTLATHR